MGGGNEHIGLPVISLAPLIRTLRIGCQRGKRI
jgi:hypothetical protein